ncbi:unnamed protein product [Urochloa humidicola]
MSGSTPRRSWLWPSLQEHHEHDGALGAGGPVALTNALDDWDDDSDEFSFTAKSSKVRFVGKKTNSKARFVGKKTKHKDAPEFRVRLRAGRRCLDWVGSGQDPSMRPPKRRRGDEIRGMGLGRLLSLKQSRRAFVRIISEAQVQRGQCSISDIIHADMAVGDNERNRDSHSLESIGVEIEPPPQEQHVIHQDYHLHDWSCRKLVLASRTRVLLTMARIVMWTCSAVAVATWTSQALSSSDMVMATLSGMETSCSI